MAGEAEQGIVMGDFGLLAHAAEMQIVAVVNHPGSGMAADPGHQLLGHLRATEQNDVEFAAGGPDPGLERGLMGTVKDLDPHALENLGIARAVAHVVRPELHQEPRLQHHMQARHDGARSGVPVRHRHVVIDHQNDLAAFRPVTGAHDVLAVAVVILLQTVAPDLDKGAAVDDLVGLDADGGVAPVRDALVMDDLGGGLIQRPQADLAQPEAQIGILEIGRRVAFVEAVEVGEDRAFDHQGGAGTVIHFADVIIRRERRVFQPAEIPSGGILPDYPARLLQPPVRIQQLRANRPGCWPVLEQRHHRRQPARQHLGIVIKKEQIAPPRRFRRPVAREQKAQIDLVTDQPDTLHVRQRTRIVAAPGIIDHDHFDRHIAGMARNRGEAPQRERQLPERRDNH